MTVWDFRNQVRRSLEAGLPSPEVRVQATSTYTAETIDAALTKLHGRDDAAAVEQREFLLALRHRKFGR